jgi:hypothetical protein
MTEEVELTEHETTKSPDNVETINTKPQGTKSRHKRLEQDITKPVEKDEPRVKLSRRQFIFVWTGLLLGLFLSSLDQTIVSTGNRHLLFQLTH